MSIEGKKNTLHLFTTGFPFSGGEPFLETEIFYLSDKFKDIIIYPWQQGTDLSVELPDNVRVSGFYSEASVSLRKIVQKYAGILLLWFILEMLKSPHRWKYLSQCKWNFYRLVGLIDTAARLNDSLPESQENQINYSYWFNEWGSVLSIVKKIRKKFRFSLRVHLYDFEEEFYTRGYLPFRYTEITAPEKIFVISEYAEKYIKRKWPQVGNAVELQRLGVNENGAGPLPETTDHFTLVTCSSLTWYKRPLLLADVIGRLKTNITWHHFGDGNMREEFLEAVKNLPANVQFVFHGHVPNREVLKFYQSEPVSLVINLSSYEGIPVALMEAISFGIPVVGCSVCGIPELVNANTGLLFNKELQPDSTAAALDHFLKSQCHHPEYRKGVKSFWNDAFNAKINYSEFSTRLQSL